MLKIEKLRIGPLPPLSFEVPAGECLAVEGPSGAGKTRLLRAIADLDPAEGYVTLDGTERSEMAAPEWRRRVRYAAAEPGWWAETARPHFAGRDRAHRRDRLLAAVGLAPDRIDRPLVELSTGERLRLALVRALIDEPKALLLDEPTAALDGSSAALVEELIRFQALAGRSVILASHDSGLIARIAHARLLLGAKPPAPPRAALPAARRA